MQVDWLTVAAQIVNFLVLVWLLRRFLYRPITAAMARREQHIADRLAEADAARAEAEAERARLKAEAEEMEAARAERLEAAREEADALRAELTAAARDAAEAERDEWRKELAHERAAFARTLRHEAAHRLVDAVRRVLADFAGGDLGGALAATFAERLRELDADPLARLRAAADGAAPVVETGVPLDAAARDRIARAVAEATGANAAPEFRETEELLVGARLTLGDQVVEWSAARYLQRVEAALDEKLEAAALAGDAEGRPA